ncbi:MAG: hypothetical protein HY583_04240 [Candidatus Omnitrophica bacterium]|nr:hypothetical protein [Candidatus Omnitrophota bacterium]
MDSLQITGTPLFYAIRFTAFLTIWIFPLGYVIAQVHRIRLQRAIEYYPFVLLVGTVFASSLYFLLRWFHIEKMLIPLMLGIDFFYLLLIDRNLSKPKSKAPSNAMTPENWILIAITIGVYIFYASDYWGGFRWTSEGGLILTNAFYSDNIWKVSIMSELQHHVPPQMPILAGYRMAYHYFAELFGVFVYHTTKIDMLSLRFYFIPSYCFLILCPLAFSALSRIFNSERIALLGLAFMLLAHSARALSLQPHMSIALGLFFALIGLMTEALNSGKRGYWILSAFLIGHLLMFESIFSICIIGSLGIGSLVLWFTKRRWEPMTTVVCGSILALALYRAAVGRFGGGYGILSLNFPFFVEAIRGFQPAKFAIKALLTYFQNHPVTFSDPSLYKLLAQLSLLLPVAFAVGFIQYYQLGIVGLPSLIKKLRGILNESATVIFFLPSIAIGLIFPLMFNVAFFWGASVRLLGFGVFLLHAFTALPVVNYWQRRSNARKILVSGAVVILLIVPNINRELRRSANSRFYTYKTLEEIEILKYLRTRTPSDSVLMHPFADDPVLDSKKNGKVGWIFEDHYYYGSALGGRRVVLEGSKTGPITQMARISLEQAKQIRFDIDTVYSTTKKKIAEELLRQYDVSYLWVPQSNAIKFKSSELLSPVVKNKDHTLYQVKKLQPHSVR